MLITRECDYAVRIVRALAGGEKLCVNQVCEKEELTPEEYRQKAQDQIEHYKQQWKVFLRTGIFVLAALVAVIIACIAWFVSNSKVSISGSNIQAAGSEFDLAAAGTRVNNGVYDNLLDVQPGTDL